MSITVDPLQLLAAIVLTVVIETIRGRRAHR